jgi:hypothetical protein
MDPRLAGDAATAVAVANRAIGYLVEAERS